MSNSSSTRSPAFARIAVQTADRPLAERLVAEAYANGAVGLEEREEAAGLTWEIYLPAGLGARVREALQAVAGRLARIGPVEDVKDADWPELWKENLCAIVISPELVVRPSCVDFEPGPGQVELVIDPGQAFGTGAHASTRLALEWIDQLAPTLEPGARVLDVGTGSGVLALAACGRGPVSATGFDLDGVAVAEARLNRAAHGFGDRLQLLTGSLEAVSGPPFELVVANLLRVEMEPLLVGMAERTAPGGAVVLSGLLLRELPRLEPLLREAGLRREGERIQADESGEDWAAILTRR